MLAEELLQCFPPEAEDLQQLRLHDRAMKEPPYYAQRQLIAHNIGHHNPFGGGFKNVLVMPHAVRAKTLFIHKCPAGFQVGDFRNPVDVYTGANCHLLGNDLTRMGLIPRLRGNIEAHFRRRDFREVGRI